MLTEIPVAKTVKDLYAALCAAYLALFRRVQAQEAFDRLLPAERKEPKGQGPFRAAPYRLPFLEAVVPCFRLVLSVQV